MLGRFLLSLAILCQCPGGTCPQPAAGRLVRPRIVVEAVQGDVIVRHLDAEDVPTCPDGTCNLGAVDDPRPAHVTGDGTPSACKSTQRGRDRVVWRRLFRWRRCR